MAHTTDRGGRKAGTRKRADAERNIVAIIAAATESFARDPDASMTDIAKAAGLGRVTLYAHFPSREQLLRTVLAETIAESTRIIEAASPAEGPPAEALARMIRSCWPLLSRFGSLHAAAQRALPADEVRRRHDRPMAHVERLVARGRAEGAFRTDLPVEWLVTTVYTLLHAAADEAAAGRLATEAVGEILEKTLLAALKSE
ncbi:TetR/AcrR family transcriptional regulator [Nonomuraea deserti]|uniref:TetR/AcrR family transcriptional regulator n=1 Tax=Nonomuraea deserti TaxID=1848322 RepID=A0A4R4UHR2_9ACTN|nr:TetR/AcrR family transcriptional regulator [Nonomuraea deserti]TDC87833.1 TetR/AcrR family transcriptional regulator [Nonomuraea deserti]